MTILHSIHYSVYSLTNLELEPRNHVITTFRHSLWWPISQIEHEKGHRSYMLGSLVLYLCSSMLLILGTLQCLMFKIMTNLLILDNSSFNLLIFLSVFAYFANWSTMLRDLSSAIRFLSWFLRSLSWSSSWTTRWTTWIKNCMQAINCASNYSPLSAQLMYLYATTLN